LGLKFNEGGLEASISSFMDSNNEKIKLFNAQEFKGEKTVWIQKSPSVFTFILEDEDSLNEINGRRQDQAKDFQVPKDIFMGKYQIENNLKVREMTKEQKNEWKNVKKQEKEELGSYERFGDSNKKLDFILEDVEKFIKENSQEFSHRDLDECYGVLQQLRNATLEKVFNLAQKVKSKFTTQRRALPKESLKGKYSLECMLICEKFPNKKYYYSIVYEQEKNQWIKVNSHSMKIKITEEEFARLTAREGQSQQYRNRGFQSYPLCLFYIKQSEAQINTLDSNLISCKETTSEKKLEVKDSFCQTIMELIENSTNDKTKSASKDSTFNDSEFVVIDNNLSPCDSETNLDEQNISIPKNSPYVTELNSSIIKQNNKSSNEDILHQTPNFHSDHSQIHQEHFSQQNLNKRNSPTEESHKCEIHTIEFLRDSCYKLLSTFTTLNQEAYNFDQALEINEISKFPSLPSFECFIILNPQEVHLAKLYLLDQIFTSQESSLSDFQNIPKHFGCKKLLEATLGNFSPEDYALLRDTLQNETIHRWKEEYKLLNQIFAVYKKLFEYSENKNWEAAFLLAHRILCKVYQSEMKSYLPNFLRFVGEIYQLVLFKLTEYIDSLFYLELFEAFRLLHVIAYYDRHSPFNQNSLYKKQIEENKRYVIDRYKANNKSEEDMEMLNCFVTNKLNKEILSKPSTKYDPENDFRSSLDSSNIIELFSLFQKNINGCIKLKKNIEKNNNPLVLGFPFTPLEEKISFHLSTV